MPHLVLIIVNKHGSLAYSKSLSAKHQFSPNDFIMLGSTLHSMHAISSQITPQCQKQKESELQNQNLLEGIEEFICSTFVLKCMQT
jgi:hypothetical protein